MNYRHSFHAGNFADVVKHVVLIALIESLSRKEKAYCYIDTHAGKGFYDFLSTEAQKTQEFIGGIEKIIHQKNLTPLVKRYLDCINHINAQLTGDKLSSLRFYPGSPLIACYFARAQDRVIACELHPEEYQSLKNTFQNFIPDKRAAIHYMDGFLGLKAFLPPKEGRGLILIDPPYENPDEFTRIANTLPTALKRFPSGVCAIWYPIKEKQQVSSFYQALCRNTKQSILTIELTIYPDLPHHLNGCGLAIINPPWQFAETMNENLPWLWKSLTINHQGSYKVLALQ